MAVLTEWQGVLFSRTEALGFWKRVKALQRIWESGGSRWESRIEAERDRDQTGWSVGFELRDIEETRYIQEKGEGTTGIEGEF